VSGSPKPLGRGDAPCINAESTDLAGFERLHSFDCILLPDTNARTLIFHGSGVADRCRRQSSKEMSAARTG
jgi:hypothetical protein